MGNIQENFNGTIAFIALLTALVLLVTAVIKLFHEINKNRRDKGDD